MNPRCVTDVPPAPIGDLDTAVRLLCEVTGSPADDVVRRLRREQRHLGANVSDELQEWDITPFEWSDHLAEFYQQSNAFLFESFVYNSTVAKHALRRWIVRFLQSDTPIPQRVLLYGDGLGFDAAYLATFGYKTAYFEVGQPCVQFARRVFEQNHVDVDVYEQQAALPSQAFDAIVCLDVLEHVPDPPALVHELAGYLRPGGRLIVHAPVWYIHSDVKTHLRSNVRYSGDWRTLYRPAGLLPIDAGFLWCPIVLSNERSAKPTTIGARLRIAISSWVLRFSRISTIPLVTFAKCFFIPTVTRDDAGSLRRFSR